MGSWGVKVNIRGRHVWVNGYTRLSVQVLTSHDVTKIFIFSRSVGFIGTRSVISSFPSVDTSLYDTTRLFFTPSKQKCASLRGFVYQVNFFIQRLIPCVESTSTRVNTFCDL